jgi:menaquinone-dependent protoporphyrinogen IX oxidase
MGNIIVMYQSKYGATRKYAQWLADALECSSVETKKATLEQVQQYDVIILGGGIYATGIAGIGFLKKHYDQLKDKKIIVFAVGASPYDDQAMAELKKRNLTDALANLPLVYCRGAWNEDAMSWKDRVLCNLLKKMVAKKDPASYAPWESALMQAVGSSHDWTEREQIQPILDLVKDQS